MKNFEYLASELYFFEKITSATIDNFRSIDEQILFNFPNAIHINTKSKHQKNSYTNLYLNH